MTRDPRLLSVATALPPHRFEQEETPADAPVDARLLVLFLLQARRV